MINLSINILEECGACDGYGGGEHWSYEEKKYIQFEICPQCHNIKETPTELGWEILRLFEWKKEYDNANKN